jgi:opacity protein-like surface antigen
MKSILSLVLLFFVAAPAFSASIYVRGGVAIEQSAEVTVSDRGCASTNPPALFGCGSGVDGRALGARGDYGSVHAFDLAIGTSFGEHARVELALTDRDLDLDAHANFTGVRGAQPVRADGASRALLLNGVWAFRERSDVQPFAFAGAGIARNELDDVRYAFPSIAPNAVTITRGGASTGVAWNAGAGVSMRMSRSFFVDVALRYADLGEVETDAGEATIIRPTRTLVLDIDGTRADAKTLGVAITLRWMR